MTFSVQMLSDSERRNLTKNLNLQKQQNVKAKNSKILGKKECMVKSSKGLDRCVEAFDIFKITI